MMLSVFSYTYLPSVCFLWGGICPYHLPTFQLVGFIYIKWRQWHPTPVLLPGKSHGHRSLVGYSPWGRKESDTTERLHFHFSLSCIGEGNGNPLQCSCLENPRDGGAWWAAIYVCGSHRVRHDWSHLAAAAINHTKWPTSICQPAASPGHALLIRHTWGFPFT